MTHYFDCNWRHWEVCLSVEVTRGAVYLTAGFGPLHFSLIYDRKR